MQTLYGHSGTITGLFTYGPHIVSSSTDKTIKVWRAVEGRAQLVYPWYDLQVRHRCLATLKYTLLTTLAVCVLSGVGVSRRNMLSSITTLLLCPQATVVTLDGWVRSMSYDRSNQVGKSPCAMLR